jgi:DNA-binding transcriptional LysR family regulator
VASLPSATGTLIAVQLRAFTERHPRVTIRLLEGSDQEVQAWLDQGAVDVAVVSLPAPGLVTAALGSQEMVAVVPVGHRLAGRAEVTYADLAHEPFIRSTGGCAHVFTPVARQLGVELDVAFEAREMSAVLEMVRAGLGVSILPTAGLPDLPGGIVTRPLTPKTTRRLAVAVSASASPAARAFLDQIDALAVGTLADRPLVRAQPIAAMDTTNRAAATTPNTAPGPRAASNGTRRKGSAAVDSFDME